MVSYKIARVWRVRNKVYLKNVQKKLECHYGYDKNLCRKNLGGREEEEETATRKEKKEYSRLQHQTKLKYS